MSGRGGTTGRAAGCPARLGLAGGRRGPPLLMPVPTPLPMVPPAVCGEGAPGRIAGRGGAGMLGIVLASPGPAGAGAGRVARPGCRGAASAVRPSEAGGICGRGCAGPLRPEGAGPEGAKPEGRGWRGPERICPGLGGGGAGLTGIVAPRAMVCETKGGTNGDPVAKGGRKGATRCGGVASSCASVSRGCDTNASGAGGGGAATS